MDNIPQFRKDWGLKKSIKYIDRLSFLSKNILNSTHYVILLKSGLYSDS